MKKLITAGIGIIACVALCAAVWPRSDEVENLPAEPVENAVSAEIEARSEETLHIFISEDMPAPEVAPVAVSEARITEITAEEKTEAVSPTAPTSHAVSKSAPASAEPKPGDRTIIDGKPYVWIPGFGWIVDEGGGSVGTMVGNPDDQLTGNKVGIMGGGTTVDGKGDINKQVGIMGSGDTPANTSPIPGTKKHIDGVLHVWVSGFGYVPYSGSNVGTVAEDMYENGNKIGIMGGDECPSSVPTVPPAEPEITGDVIYAPIQPPVTKDSTPPAYKPNGELYNP